MSTLYFLRSVKTDHRYTNSCLPAFCYVDNFLESWTLISIYRALRVTWPSLTWWREVLLLPSSAAWQSWAARCSSSQVRLRLRVWRYNMFSVCPSDFIVSCCCDIRLKWSVKHFIETEQILSSMCVARELSLFFQSMTQILRLRQCRKQHSWCWIVWPHPPLLFRPLSSWRRDDSCCYLRLF